MTMRWLYLLIALLFAPLAWGQALDINTADMTQLDALPGIGPAKATAILEYRGSHGPFLNVEDVVNVPGIGPATMANIRSLIMVGEGIGDATPGVDEPEQNPGEVIAPREKPAGNAPPTNAVNINKASVEGLLTLPGIGPTKAEAIHADREANGPFASCQDLTRVVGIGPATVANIASRCSVK